MTITSADWRFHEGSFRDRAGRVVCHGDRVFRYLSRAALTEWDDVSARPFVQRAMEAGRIVRTVRAVSRDREAGQAGFHAAVEHERLPVISWPYEWCFSMLREAAMLTLELMRHALAEDCILKDATPFNIQFRGASPVLMDTGSLTPLPPGGIWEGYRQFCSLFLFPLMLQAWKDVDFQPWLRGSLEGITPTMFSRLLSLRDLFRPGALTHVWLHARLEQSAGRSRKPRQSVSRSLQDSGFEKSLIARNVDGLRQLVERLRWGRATSAWSDYDRQATPVLRDSAAKELFVEQICASRRWPVVWDLGCNLGRYSRIAAAHADLVVALDSDHLTVDLLFRRLQQESCPNIVPLVMNLADPSPSLGWRGMERADLPHRSRPHLILCLALIHHLVIGSNLLLDDVIAWLASFQAVIVLEFVDRDDEQVRILLANRRDVFEDYTHDRFRQAISRHFSIIRETRLGEGTRTLYLLQPAAKPAPRAAAQLTEQRS